MSRHGSLRWQRLIAALVIAALVYGMAFFLRSKGLSGAANFVQVVSAFSLIISLINWAWSRKSAERDRLPDRQPTGPNFREPTEALPPREMSLHPPEQVFSSHVGENSVLTSAQTSAPNSRILPRKPSDDDEQSCESSSESSRTALRKRWRTIVRNLAFIGGLVTFLAAIAQITGVSVTSLMSHPSPLSSVAVAPSARGQSYPPNQQTATPQASSLSLQPYSSPPGQLTFTEVQDALLQSSEVASAGGSFVATNIQPQSKTCDRIPTHPLVSAARQFTDDVRSYLSIAEQIDVFSSIRSAQSAFAASSPHLGCDSSATKTNKTDTTDQIQGFCDQTMAVKYYAPTKNHLTASYYLAELRCGRILLHFVAGTIEGLAADDESSLYFAVEAAVPKLRTLGQP